MFGIGGFELFIILLFGFLVFGPDKLPEMAKTLGAALRKFKQAQEEMEQVIKGEVLEADRGASPSGKAGSSKPAPNASQESFAARKARYDKQRAEREAARRAELDANRRAMREEAARKAASAASSDAAAERGGAAGQGVAAEGVGADEAFEGAFASGSSSAAKSVSRVAVPELTPDELFGAKPIKPVPGSKAPARAVSTPAPEPTGQEAAQPSSATPAPHSGVSSASSSAAGSAKGGE